jgi:hypothetical protein
MKFISKTGDFFAHLYRKFVVKRIVKKIIKAVENELLDSFLELLLSFIRLVLCVNKGYRRNLENFEARYAFKSRDGKIAASAIFKDNKMKVHKYEIENTNITVIFKDGKSLWEFLFSDDPDVFEFILDNKLSYIGNINYVLKFGYMAKHLKLMFSL